jgi:hypothetical protein
MTPDERTLLSTFLNDLAQARAAGKDGEADGMIRQAFAANPDAAYLIVQHAILSDQALHAAQVRIAELESGRGSSFLGGRPSPPQPPPQATAVPPSQPYAPPPAYQPGASAFASGGGLGSFLRNAGTMAAGVAAGDFLFEGLSGLFGGHRGFGFGGGSFGGYGAPVENVTINEYGDRDGFRDDGGSSNDDPGGYDDGGGWSDDS